MINIVGDWGINFGLAMVLLPSCDGANGRRNSQIGVDEYCDQDAGSINHFASA